MELDLNAFNKLLLETVGVGLVIATSPALDVVFRNQRVVELFPGFDDEAGNLCQRIEGVDEAVLVSALEKRQKYQVSIKAKTGRRARALSLTANPARIGESSLVIVELQDDTKLHALEAMIESYSKMVEQQNRLLKREKERAEKLLLNIMPESVYKELKTFGATTPQRYDDASILMLDFVGFTQMSVEYDPSTIVRELNDIFTAFDRIAEQQGCERIKTIGDAYVAVAGLPEPSSDHAEAIARLALMCVRYLKHRNENQRLQWKCRIGLAPGPVIGSVVGIQKYVYDIFGPGINLAARLEAQADPMDILISEEMYQHLRAKFPVEDLGDVELRGFGSKRVYRLLAADDLSVDIE